MKCCVESCHNSQGKNQKAVDGITFHMFPKNEYLKKLWMEKLEKEEGWKPTKISVVCSKHFQDDAFINTKKGLRRIRPGVVPCFQLEEEKIEGQVESVVIKERPAKSKNDYSEYIARLEEQIENDPINIEELPPLIQIKKLKYKILQLKFADRKKHLKIKSLQAAQRRRAKKMTNSDPCATECSGPSKKKGRHDTADSASEDDPAIENAEGNESEDGEMRVGTGRDVLRVWRDSLKKELIMDLHALSDKVQQFVPEVSQRPFSLHFRGEDGNEAEYMFVSASETRRLGLRHSNLRCNGCRNAVVGSRYTCVVCADYDLCASCEALGVHPQHVMLRITKPVKSRQAREMLQELVRKMKADGIDQILGDTTNPQEPAPGPSCIKPMAEVPIVYKTKGKATSTPEMPASTKKNVEKLTEPDKENETEEVLDSTSGEETENEDRDKAMETEIKIEPKDVYDSFSETAEPIVTMEAEIMEDLDPLGGVKQEQPEAMDTAQPTVWPFTLGTAVPPPSQSLVECPDNRGGRQGSNLMMAQDVNLTSKEAHTLVIGQSGPSMSVVECSSNAASTAGTSSRTGPAQKVIAMSPSFELPSGMVLPAGSTVPPGLILPKRYTLPQGVKLTPDTRLTVPVSLPPGTMMPAGLALPPGYVMQQVVVNPVTTATVDSATESSFLTYTHSKGS